MKNRLLHLLIPAFILAGFTFQSCGNIDIVKRRYRPGFHVDVTKKRDKSAKAEETATVEKQKLEKVASKKARLKTEEVDSEEKIDAFTENASASINTDSNNKKLTGKKVNDFLLTPFREIKRQKLDGELKRAVFNKEKEEKYGWSVTSFVSTGIGVVALGLLIAGIVLLAAFLLGSTFAYWWIFLATGVLFGIGALVTGILGLRQTGSGERRGRGFAIAGLVTGIVSLAAGLIGLIWGLFFSIFLGGQEDF